MEQVKVGMFNLPGLKFEKEFLPPELLVEMESWATENNCGKLMNEWLWSFKNEKQREWFILRWSDEINKLEREKEQDA